MEVKVGTLNLGGTEANIVAEGGKSVYLRLIPKERLDLMRLFKTVPFGRMRDIELSESGEVVMRGTPRLLMKTCREMEGEGYLKRSPGISYGVLENDLIEASSPKMAEELKK